MSERTDKVAQQIRRIVGEQIQRSSSLKPLFLTVQDVVVTSDLKYATVWVSTMSKVPNGEIMSLLKHESYDINGIIKNTIESKYSPKVSFRIGVPEENTVENLLDEIKRTQDNS